MGPVVSSDRTTSRKGLRKTLGSTSARSKGADRYNTAVSQIGQQETTGPTHFSSTFQGHFQNVQHLMAGLKHTYRNFITMIYNLLGLKTLK